jgi:two-component system, LuxR family, response regulator FixJ
MWGALGRCYPRVTAQYAPRTGEAPSGLSGADAVTSAAEVPPSRRPKMDPNDDIPEHDGRGAGPLIVLVEDDVSVRKALSFALRIEGFRIEVHDSAEALLQAAELPDAACLVLDQNLPGALGAEALVELRRRGLACPAILITTQPKPEVRIAVERLGAHILEKPLLGGELPAAIRALLGL